MVGNPRAPTPPAAPSDLAAAGGAGQATLSWTDNADNETVYRIERKPAVQPDSSFNEIATAGSNATGYTDVGLAADLYSYRVRASNSDGHSGYSNVAEAIVIPMPAPAAPSNLVAIGGVNRVALSWNDNSSTETGFKIERKLASAPDTSYLLLTTVGANVRAHDDLGLAAGDYSYRVQASGNTGDSAYCDPAQATVTAPSGPAAPSNLLATVSNGNQVTLNWTDNSSNETGFRIERKVGAASYTTLVTKGAGVTTHSDPGLAANTYSYRVIATGAVASPASNEAVVIIGRTPVADAYVRSGSSASTNFGAALVLDVKTNPVDSTNRNAFLRFSLTGVSGTVTSAKLRLFGNAATSAKPVSVHAVADVTWSESGITWNYPSTGAGGPAVSAPLTPSNPTVGLTPGWIEWDVTSYIQQQKAAGAAAVSLGVKSALSSEEGQTTFNSREGTNKPVLIISSRP